MSIKIEQINHSIIPHPTHQYSSILSVECVIDGVLYRQDISILNDVIKDIIDDEAYVHNIISDVIKKMYCDILFEKFFVQHKDFASKINIKEIIESIKNNCLDS